MANQIASPRGTQDLLPNESYRWQYVERKVIETAGLYGFKEIRTPTFEHTELFDRGVGDTTDVVQKEMYTFMDKGNRSITLRPEITAGVSRTMIQHGLLGSGVLPQRACYTASCFRYEKKQATRLREFHQFGIEAFGSKGPQSDAQVIAVGYQVLTTLGVTNARLLINSIGCPECRKKYQEALIEYFKQHTEGLCETCLERLEKNPMRIVDCKVQGCKDIAKDAPNILNFICEGCQEHFEGLQRCLKALEIPYEIDPTIVRGLDYYTKTVFEFVANYRGEKVTVCGGGRYDGLIELLGGPPTPALGFGMGIERLLLVMEECGAEFPEDSRCHIYIGSMGEAAQMKALQLAHKLHQEGFWAECDDMERSVKAQMKYANKIGAKYTMILGEEELEKGEATLKEMESGRTETVRIEEKAFLEAIYGTLYQPIAESEISR